LEILDDSDVYCILEANVDAQIFAELKARSGLLIDFADFPAEVGGLLRDSLRAGPSLTVTFWEGGDGRGSLEFNELLELKRVAILRIEFGPSNAEFVSRQLQYRYDNITRELARKKARLSALKREIHARSPILSRAMDSRLKSSRPI
jgi:hypothetical protein